MEVVGAVLIFPVVVLMLSPFVIIARGRGARAGMREGWRLLRNDWAALVVLFVIFRAAYEVVALWKAATPWPMEHDGLISLRMGVGPLAWLGSSYLLLALLGLWVAYAFMAIATSAESSAPETEGRSILASRREPGQ